MTIEESIARTLSERKLGRDALLETVEEIRALERLGKTLTDAASSSALDDLIVERKRFAKGKLEGLEKVSESYDKAALPLAAFFIGLASWATATSRQIVPPAHIVQVEVACGVLGVILWLGCRYQYLRLAKTARMALARLGKVD